MRLQAEIEEFSRGMLEKANTEKNRAKCNPMDESWEDLLEGLIDEMYELIEEVYNIHEGDTKYAPIRLPYEAYDVALRAMFLAMKAKQNGG